ncbi:hypothetical protein OPKNFCMD_5475 [Methylobacterium crusticola]|uniref:XRE family transcriptional regulator n=1 Tax=Methylobacterium crusticola TaxID=1697972 RepID=A0ABQ4R646_9HYPH|nr:hypothetical protein OPKNFCMD_5475 [Methylobacterium crusticola]
MNSTAFAIVGPALKRMRERRAREAWLEVEHGESPQDAQS